MGHFENPKVYESKRKYVSQLGLVEIYWLWSYKGYQPNVTKGPNLMWKGEGYLIKKIHGNPVPCSKIFMDVSPKFYLP